MKPKGVLSVDDTLLTHYGRHFDEIAFLYDPVERALCRAHNLVNLHYSDDQTDYPSFPVVETGGLGKIEQGLQAVGIRLRKSKFALKESDPKKWRQYLLGVWSRKQGKPEVAALYQSKLLIARRNCCTMGERESRIETACHVRQLVHATGLLPFSGPRNLNCPTWALWPVTIKSF